jgi:predicted MFS family arabinose efflux permease
MQIQMNRYLKILLTINSISIIADYLLIPIFAIFITEIGQKGQLAGILFSFQFFISAVVGILVSRIYDHKGLSDTFIELNYLLKGIAWSILAFNQSIPTLLIAQLFIGIAGAIGAPAYQSLISEHLDKDRHIGDWSITLLSKNISVALGSILSGFLFYTLGFNYLFAIMAIIEFVALYLYILLLKGK